MDSLQLDLRSGAQRGVKRGNDKGSKEEHVTEARPTLVKLQITNRGKNLNSSAKIIEVDEEYKRKQSVSDATVSALLGLIAPKDTNYLRKLESVLLSGNQKIEPIVKLTNLLEEAKEESERKWEEEKAARKAKEEDNEESEESSSNEIINDDNVNKVPSGSSILQYDPLRQFGLLVPESLKTAQKEFMKALSLTVELANIQLEMKDIMKQLQ